MLYNRTEHSKGFFTCLILSIVYCIQTAVEIKTLNFLFAQKFATSTKIGAISFPDSLYRSSLSFGEGPWFRLVTWPPRSQTFPTEESKRINWSERKSIASHRYFNLRTGKNTFEIPHFYAKLYTSQTKWIYNYIHRIEVSSWLRIQAVVLLGSETMSPFYVALINLTTHCSLYERLFYLPYCKILFLTLHAKELR